MNDKMNLLVTRLGSGVLIVTGLVAILVGYLGVRDESVTSLQMPYFVSGGLGGLALIVLGVGGLISVQLRLAQSGRAAVIESLEVWKEKALAEFRSFLENAEVEIRVDEPRNGARNPTGGPARALRVESETI